MKGEMQCGVEWEMWNVKYEIKLDMKNKKGHGVKKIN